MKFFFSRTCFVDENDAASDQDDDDVSSSGSSQTQAIDSSEPSTPEYADFDVTPSGENVVTWAELAQSWTNQDEDSKQDVNNVPVKQDSNGEAAINVDASQNKTDEAKLADTCDVMPTLTASVNSNVHASNHNDMSHVDDPVLQQVHDKNTAATHNPRHSCTETSASSSEPSTVAGNHHKTRRVVKITKERRRKKLRKQPSLAELTAQWFVARLTALFGDQLDKSWTYFLAVVTLGACLAVAVELNPLYMIVAVALSSFVAFYFWFQL